MSEWISATVADVTKYQKAGGTPLATNPKYYVGDIPFVVIEDITDSSHYLTNTKKSINKNGLDASAAWLIEEQHVLYSMYATIGKPIINKISCATNQAIIALKENELIEQEYLYYQLQFIRPFVYKFTSQTTQSNLNAGTVKKLPIYYPKSKTRQNKIIQILQAIDQAIEKTEALIEKYQQIKAGLMHDLFTRGIGTDGKLRPPREVAPEFYQLTPTGWIPKDWSYSSFGECIDLLTDYHANGAYEILKDHVELLDHRDFAVMIRTTNFQQNDFDRDVKYITKKAFSFLSKSVVYPSDILMNKIANPGVSYLMPDLGVPVSLGMNLFLIRIKAGISSKFIHAYLCFKEEYVKSFSNGTGTKTITKDAVRSLIITMPKSPDEIILISNSLTDMNEKIVKEMAYLNTLNNQKIGLMHDLLTGKVQVPIQNPQSAYV